MNYQSKNEKGEVISFTKEQVDSKNQFVWHLTDNTAVYPPKQHFIDVVSTEMFAQMDIWGTHPSDNAMSALREVVAHIWDTVEGDVEEKAYITPLDCGVGKTTAMKFSLKHLIEWGYDAGALLLFYQIAEAENAYADFVEMFGAGQVGLLTSERETENYKDKNILIITQQRFCAKLVSNKNEEKKHYNDVELFRLNDKPRELRFWDERLNPAVSRTITTKDLQKLSYDLTDEDQQERVINFAEWVKGKLKRSDTKIPVKFKDFGLTSKDFNSDADPQHKEAFLALQGETIVAYSAKTSGGKEGNLSPTKETMMTYKVEVPADAGVFPLFVLDASYRVNKVSYQKMARQLPIELDNIIGDGYKKTYKNLAINWWDIGTGKDSWDSRKGKVKREKLVAGIAKAVCSTKKRSLIVCGKDQLPFIKDNLVLDCDVEAPAYLTWGKHTATNEFKDVDNVIITHLFNKPDYHYYAELRAYLGLAPEEDFEEDSLKDFWRGDAWDSLYQASLRGKARQLDGDACKAMTLWVFASSKTPNVLLKDAWHQVYPQAVVKKVMVEHKPKEFSGVAGKCFKMAEWFNKQTDKEVPIDVALLERFILTKEQIRQLRKRNHDLMASIGELGVQFETRGKARGQKTYLIKQGGFKISPEAQ
jgi:hypothetical protein